MMLCSASYQPKRLVKLGHIVNCLMIFRCKLVISSAAGGMLSTEPTPWPADHTSRHGFSRYSSGRAHLPALYLYPACHDLHVLAYGCSAFCLNEASPCHRICCDNIQAHNPSPSAYSGWRAFTGGDKACTHIARSAPIIWAAAISRPVLSALIAARYRQKTV